MGAYNLLVAALVFSIVSCLFIAIEAKVGDNQTDDCYKPCRVKSSPVCGNDGRNYTTGCHFSVARCRARKIGQSLVAMQGYCQSSKPVSQCLLSCTDRKAPVCGSDMRIYRNLCLFKKARCEARKKKMKPLSRIPCKKQTPKCRLLSSCPKVKRPVCGSDSKTYRNICFLKTKNCRLKRAAKGKPFKKLILKHCGACGRRRRLRQWRTLKCPEVKFCDQLLRAAVRHAETKGNGKPTKLKKGRKNSKARVPRLKKKKLLKKKSSKKSKTLRTKLKTRTRPNGKKTGKIGPKKLFQICGSDGVTYSSLCHLQIEQCNRMNRCQRLQMKHKGACNKRPRRRT